MLKNDGFVCRNACDFDTGRACIEVRGNTLERGAYYKRNLCFKIPPFHEEKRIKSVGMCIDCRRIKRNYGVGLPFCETYM